MKLNCDCCSMLTCLVTLWVRNQHPSPFFSFGFVLFYFTISCTFTLLWHSGVIWVVNVRLASERSWFQLLFRSHIATLHKYFGGHASIINQYHLVPDKGSGWQDSVMVRALNLWLEKSWVELATVPVSSNDSGQVVNIVTKHYSLLLAKCWWCYVAGKLESNSTLPPCSCLSPVHWLPSNYGLSLYQEWDYLYRQW